MGYIKIDDGNLEELENDLGKRAFQICETVPLDVGKRLMNVINEFIEEDECEGETFNREQANELLPLVSVSLPLDADQTWPTRDVLNKLIEASEILLHKKDYDGHGWEEIAHCVDLAKGIVKRIGNEL